APKINETALSMNLIDNDRKLECIRTKIDEIGVEVVVFDEMMVAEGIKRWDLNLYIVDYRNDVFFMKFHHEEGLNNVVNSGPWMVNTWTVKAISALASRIGKPLVMDVVTASKCRQRIGMLRFARVLIEKPPVCFECRVFGHAESSCPKKEPIKSINVNSEKDDTVVQIGIIDAYKKVNDGFVEVGSRKNVGINNKVKRPNYKANPHNNKFGNNVKNVYKAKNMNQVEKEKTLVKSSEKNISEAIKRSTNKFTMFEMYDLKEHNELREIKNMEIVNEFLNKNVTPTESDMISWDLDMIAYYKQIIKLLVDKGERNEEEDVLQENCQKDERLEEAGLKKLAWKNGDVFENVKRLREFMKEAMKEEELILYQKAKVKWLSVGDRNNAHFYKAIKSRQQRNRIDVVCDENGKRFEGSEVADQFVIHFQKFLGESKDVEKISDMGSLLQNKLSIEVATFMIRKISDEDIKHAMFQIDDNKAPGQMDF
nr:hypothetical protein [Tanacetum cinerariifolium]